ncbi:MAG: hypothetical protein QME25_00220 [Bacteroidota bacterium]|nr:hypothetical protein [Bacteroidota bacterium]
MKNKGDLMSPEQRIALIKELEQMKRFQGFFSGKLRRYVAAIAEFLVGVLVMAGAVIVTLKTENMLLGSVLFLVSFVILAQAVYIIVRYNINKRLRLISVKFPCLRLASLCAAERAGRRLFLWFK